MKALLFFIIFPSVAFAYSGADLSGTHAAQQIATVLFLYADEKRGAVDVPYQDVPGVAFELKQFSYRGTFAFPSHRTYSANSTEPVPVVFYSTDNMVAVGYGNGTHKYFEVEKRPPWMRLRHGPSWWEWAIMLSFFVNFVVLLYFGGNGLQKLAIRRSAVKAR